MSAEQQQDQRPKSSASSKKSASSRKSSDEQRGHQLSDDGPAPAAAAGVPDAYQQLSDDQPESGADGEKADKPKKENPLKKFIASLKSLSCTGKPANLDKAGEKNGAQDDDENAPNARPVSQSSLESKKVVTEKSAPQIDVSPAVEDSDKKDEKKEDGEDKKDEEKIASPVEPAANAPLTTTAISATPPTL